MLASEERNRFFVHRGQMGPVLRSHRRDGKISTLTQKQLLPLLVGTASGLGPGCQRPASTKLTKDVSLGRRSR